MSIFFLILCRMSKTGRNNPNNDQLKKSAGVIKSSLPKIKDVNVIDKYSRVVFPVSFILFNVAYWCFYVMDTDGPDGA